MLFRTAKTFYENTLWETTAHTEVQPKVQCNELSVQERGDAFAA